MPTPATTNTALLRAVGSVVEYQAGHRDCAVRHGWVDIGRSGITNNLARGRCRCGANLSQILCVKLRSPLAYCLAQQKFRNFSSLKRYGNGWNGRRS